MLVLDVDGTALAVAESDALRRVASLFSRVDPALPVGDGTWTSRDVAAHLVTVIGRYLNSDVRLGRTPREVDEINRQEMQALAELPMDQLVDRLDVASAAYQRGWSRLPLDMQLPFHAGIELDVASLRSNWLGELLIHARDVAASAGEPWEIAEHDALLLVRLVLTALPGYLRAAELHDAVLLMVANSGRPASIAISAGTVSVSDSVLPNDASVRSPADVLALTLYSRLSLAAAEERGLEIHGHRDRVTSFFSSLIAP
ncbi:MAG: hypothetical protein NVS3B26_03890 [Mycobacteriales bacterium]